MQIRKRRLIDCCLHCVSVESDANEFEQWARLRVAIRLPVELTPEDWYQKLEEIAVDCEIERIGFAVPAWASDKNSRLVRAFLSGIRSQGGEPRFVFYKTGTANLQYCCTCLEMSCSCVWTWGLSLDHTPNEHIDLNDYQNAVNVLTHLLSGLQT